MKTTHHVTAWLIAAKATSRRMNWWNVFSEQRSRNFISCSLRYRTIQAAYMLVKSECWWLYLGDNFSMLVTDFDIGDIYWMLVPGANVRRKRMLATKTHETVTNISKLSATYFVPNIRHQHRYSQLYVVGLISEWFLNCHFKA